MSIRTRFAPSPTGELHLGNARTAVLNWLYARHEGGKFVLRFEDTDVERNLEAAERAIVEGLDWLGLDRDEDPVRGGPFGPYRQSERLELYRATAERLLAEGAAYRCYCEPPADPGGTSRQREVPGEAEVSPAPEGRSGCSGACRHLDPARARELEKQGRSPAVRFLVPREPIRFRDRLRGEITISGSDFGDFVILRSDGRPTYNFAVVVDDLAMRISHVIRGAGHLGNTPKQLLIYQALGTTAPEFVHVPDVLAPGGSKLSKRRGAPGLSHYRERGYHPEAVVNYLSLLSWSSPTGEEVLTRQELLRQMDLDRLGTSPPILDPEKMRWLSGQHIRREEPESLARRLEAFVDRDRYGLDTEEWIAFARLVRPRIHLLREAAEEAEHIYGEPRPDGEARSALSAPTAVEALRFVLEEFEALPAWNRESVRDALDRVAGQKGIRGGALFRPLRVALTGRLRGPELPDLLAALGRKRTLRRVRRTLDRLEADDG